MAARMPERAPQLPSRAFVEHVRAARTPGASTVQRAPTFSRIATRPPHWHSHLGAERSESRPYHRQRVHSMRLRGPRSSLAPTTARIGARQYPVFADFRARRSVFANARVSDFDAYPYERNAALLGARGFRVCTNALPERRRVFASIHGA